MLDIKNFLRNNLAIFTIYLLLVFIFYHKAFWGYFQGDEWFYFTQFLPLTEKDNGLLLALYKSVFDIQAVSGGGHLTPVYNVVWYLFNALFKLNYFPYIFSSVILHGVNAYLVYLFTKRLVRNSQIGFFAGLFFALSYIHNQAVTWIMAFIPTVLSVTFIMLALLYCLKYTDEKYKVRNILWLFLFTFLACMTKESSVILFVLIPVIITLRSRISLHKQFIKYYVITLFVYMPFRLLIPWLLHYVDAQTGNPTVSEKIGLDLHMFRAITYPIKAFVEVFVPAEYILAVSEFLTPYAYQTYGAEKAFRGINYLIFTQGAGSDMVIYFVAFLMILGCYHFLKHIRVGDKNLYTAFIIGLLVIVLGALPLIMIATYAPWWGYVTFIDSRHLYIISIGGSILFGIITLKLIQGFNTHFRIHPLLFPLAFLLFWFSLHFVLLQNDLHKSTTTAFQRKTVINTITNTVPKGLNKKVIFIESNTGYYGFPTIPPFQTNLGQILTVKYFTDGELPEEFLMSQYLTKNGLLGEGYKTVGDKGFGYYLNKNTLIEEFDKQKFSVNDVFCFFWNGRDNTLKESTDKCRRVLLYERGISKETQDKT